MQHLPDLSRIALGNRHLRAALAVGIAQISIPPRAWRQPSAPAVNESRPEPHAVALDTAHHRLPIGSRVRLSKSKKKDLTRVAKGATLPWSDK
jgi:hypothetical protein